MRTSLLSAAWLLQLALGTIIPPMSHISGRANDMKQAAADMGKFLSPDASIVLPSDSEWNSLVARISYPRVSPSYVAAVEVATEHDVELVVSYAVKKNIPFLAVSGSHGWTSALNKLQNGIQINMRKLNSTTISSDGNTATIGGGSLQWETTKALFAQRKLTVTGSCECVSVLGPLLGGGHSLLQNQHGFALDNIISARVVLANGTLVQTSSTQYPDLFWALRGAGHNFGIVTSVVLKVYDIPVGSQWTVYTFLFAQEKIEPLFNLINSFESPTRDSKLVLTGAAAKIPPVDPDKPVIAYNVAYDGTQAELDPYANQFKALGPISTTLTANVEYDQLYKTIGTNLDNSVCTKNQNLLGAGASAPAWNITGIRKAVELLGNFTADPRFTQSAILFESYGMNGVRAVDPSTTALSADERVDSAVAASILSWQGVDTQANQLAAQYSVQIRDALLMGVGTNRHGYLNYASGDESKQMNYGYEQWRLDKLAALKAIWDPQNAFRYYAPLVT